MCPCFQGVRRDLSQISAAETSPLKGEKSARGRRYQLPGPFVIPTDPSEWRRSNMFCDVLMRVRIHARKLITGRSQDLGTPDSSFSSRF